MAPTVSTQPEVTRLSGVLGAEVRGVDLANLDDETFETIRELFLDHLVLLFPGANLTPAAHVAFGARFGELSVHPHGPNLEGFPEVLVVESDRGKSDKWHTDMTWVERPPMLTSLKLVTVPAVGGDTLWSNQYLAYERLSGPMRDLLDGLTAVHSSLPAYPNAPEEVWTHPVVRLHPETGRKCLFVNGLYPTHIVELSRGESDAVLRYLSVWSERPDFQCRYRWTAGDLAIWDNRCTQHFAVADYDEFRRAERLTVIGDVPRGG
jgi:taurine dioxygenase